MPEKIDTVLTLAREKKLHIKLMYRLAVLIVITGVYGGVLVYDVLFKGLSVWIALPFVVVSYLAGLFVFARINQVSWDAKKEILLAGNIDFLGFILLAAYFVIRFTAGTLIGRVYHNALIISGLSFAVFFGVMLGRLLGTINIIHVANLEKKKIME